jgi:hypothetical protein
VKLQRTDVKQVKKQVPQMLKAIQSDNEPDEGSADDQSNLEESNIQLDTFKYVAGKKRS